jgi:hypothetical protein
MNVVEIAKVSYSTCKRVQPSDGVLLTSWHFMPRQALEFQAKESNAALNHHRGRADRNIELAKIEYYRRIDLYQ